MKNQEKPASFINKLYNILKSKQHSKAIIWDNQLKGIRVLNQKRLEQTVLPRYYRHNRFASFVRQLNMYDFHKIHLGDHKSYFHHDTFNPKDKQTIYIVKRKVTFNLQNTDKNSSSGEKQVLSQDRKSIRSQKYVIQSQKQNIWSQRSSFRLVKNSLRLLSQKRSQKLFQLNSISQAQAIQQLLQQILPLNLSSDQIKMQIRKLQKNAIYKRLLKNKQFKAKLYQRLGIQFDAENENLSELSIQGELLIKTKKSITQRSLMQFESGPINYKDTLRCLMEL